MCWRFSSKNVVRILHCKDSSLRIQNLPKGLLIAGVGSIVKLSNLLGSVSVSLTKLCLAPLNSKPMVKKSDKVDLSSHAFPSEVEEESTHLKSLYVNT